MSNEVKIVVVIYFHQPQLTKCVKKKENIFHQNGKQKTMKGLERLEKIKLIKRKQ